MAKGIFLFNHVFNKHVCLFFLNFLPPFPWGSLGPTGRRSLPTAPKNQDQGHLREHLGTPSNMHPRATGFMRICSVPREVG